MVGGEIADLNFKAYAELDNGEILHGKNFTFDIQEGKIEWVIRY